MAQTTEGIATKQELEPREPVAYPRYPKRVAGARRPVWEPVQDGAKTEADSGG